MKKPSFCTALLIIFLGLWAFFEIKDTIKGDKQFFLVRWMFSNRGYAENIEIKPYLLNDEQAARLLAHPDEEIQQPPQKELYLKNVNVVLRIQNRGRTMPWGTLAYSTDHANWWKMDVAVPPMNAKNGKPFYDFIIPVGVVVLHDNNDPPKPVLVRWISLYTKF